MGQSPHGGWFAYVPYTRTHVLAGVEHGLLRAGVLFVTISTTVGAINFIVTIFGSPRRA